MLIRPMPHTKPQALRGLKLLVFISLTLALPGRSNELLPSFLPSVKAVEDLVLPLGDSDGKPMLKFLCGRAHLERKSIGFLKIGILPQLVLEDVEVIIMKSRDSLTWARALSDFFMSNPELSRAVIKNIRMRVSGHDGFVSAARGGFNDKTQEFLLEDVDYKYGTNALGRCSKVVVHLQGPNAGRLLLKETPTRIIKISDEGFAPTAN